MIQAVSKINFKKVEPVYNQYGGEKYLRDSNSPSNKVLSKDEFIKNKTNKKDNLKIILGLSFGMTALFYGLLSKAKIF